VAIRRAVWRFVAFGRARVSLVRGVPESTEFVAVGPTAATLAPYLIFEVTKAP
jgi:hypothetical protein